MPYFRLNTGCMVNFSLQEIFVQVPFGLKSYVKNYAHTNSVYPKTHSSTKNMTIFLWKVRQVLPLAKKKLRTNKPNM